MNERNETSSLELYHVFFTLEKAKDGFDLDCRVWITADENPKLVDVERFYGGRRGDHAGRYFKDELLGKNPGTYTGHDADEILLKLGKIRRTSGL